jgi:hypothetical protein
MSSVVRSVARHREKQEPTIEVTMTRRTKMGPQFLSLILPVLFIVCSFGSSAALPGEECTAPSSYAQVRVSTLDPPVIAPGDDDQPTIGSRKRERQLGISSSPESPTPAGTAVAKPFGTGISWIQRIRVFMGRLGVLLLRMPS